MCDKHLIIFTFRLDDGLEEKKIKENVFYKIKCAKHLLGKKICFVMKTLKKIF